MSNLREKLEKLASDEPSDWLEKARFHHENREWLKRSAIIAIHVLSALKRQNLSQKELADKLKVSPQQVSKIVKGQENLTLETISALETALGIKIINDKFRRNSSKAAKHTPKTRSTKPKTGNTKLAV